MFRVRFATGFVKEHKLVFGVSVLILSFTLCIQFVFFSLISNSEKTKFGDYEYSISGLQIQTDRFSSFVDNLISFGIETSDQTIYSDIQLQGKDGNTQSVNVILDEKMDFENELALYAGGAEIEALTKQAGKDKESSSIVVEYETPYICLNEEFYPIYPIIEEITFLIPEGGRFLCCKRELFEKVFPSVNGFLFSTDLPLSENQEFKLSKYAQEFGGSFRSKTPPRYNEENAVLRYVLVFVLGGILYCAMKVMWYLLTLRLPELSISNMLGMSFFDIYINEWITFLMALIPAVLLGSVEYLLFRFWQGRNSNLLNLETEGVLTQIYIFAGLAVLVFWLFVICHSVFRRRPKHA